MARRKRTIGGGALKPGFNYTAMGGHDEFTELTDTPSSFTGYGGYVVNVNAGANALEFTDALAKIIIDNTDNTPKYLGAKLYSFLGTHSGISLGQRGLNPNQQVEIQAAIDDSTINFDGSEQLRVKPLGITPAQVATANKDGTAGTLSLRTLGTGAQQAAAGNHGHTLVFSRGNGVYAPTGVITGVTLIAWRAPFACTVTNVRGYRVGGTGATVNARRNAGASGNHLASNLSLTSTGTWMDGGTVQDTSYSAGDKLEVMIVTAAGVPTQILIQVDFTRTLS